MFVLDVEFDGDGYVEGISGGVCGLEASTHWTAVKSKLGFRLPRRSRYLRDRRHHFE